MKNIQTTFQRLEKKYVLNKEQYQHLKQFLEPHMQEDDYGKSTICNIYYDTQYYELITQSLQKPPYKEKFRIRSYGTPDRDSIIYLEIKKKWHSVVHKRRVGMPYVEAMKYLQYGICPQENSQITAEITYFLQFYKPIPKVFLAYDREPLQGIEEKELRITFDHHIRTRYHDLYLTSGDQGELLFKEEQILMEIKVLDAYPLWLSKELSEQQIFPLSFSKYGAAFMEDILKKEREQLCLQVY